MKEFIGKHFSSFSFFYRILRYRMFYALAVGIAIGLLDGFGLAMFLPLLQLAGGENQATGEGMGKLDFLVDLLRDVGLELNLINILLALVAIFVLKGVLSYFGNIYQVHIQQYFLSTLRLKLLHNFNRIEYKLFVQWDAGRVQNVFTTETERITNAFIHYFRSLNMGVNVLVYAGFAFTVDPLFAALVVMGGSLSHIIYRRLYKLSRAASRNLSSGNSLFHGLIVQHITNFKYLKATGRKEFFSEKLEESVKTIENENKRLGVYAALMKAIREPLLIIVVATVMIIQTQILNKSLAPILISLLFFYRALSSLNNLQSIWNLFIKFSGSLENVNQFNIEVRHSREKRGGQNQFASDFTKLALDAVSFNYSEEKVLNEVSFVIKKNESIAIVGESGSGKTTLLNIMAGLLRPSNGVYKVDQINIEDLNMQSFQHRIGFISQEPVIFEGSLFENISFWEAKTDENLKRFWKAVELSALLDFVHSFKEQEDFLISSGGVNLSGGQRQRIAIARELFREVDILIFDEGTSALDGKTEKYIQRSLDKLKGSYTIITVAHRLATVKNADKIALMSEGKLVNFLPFEELIRSEKQFKKMVELQSI